MLRKFIILSLMLVSLLGINACDSEPPALMKATKQFKSDEIRDQHIAYMRKNHMDALKHKRDETMYKGIRTKKHSINACINCHVPESYKGKVLRHTDQEHFCTTCHTYVAAKLDCFECHVDHPVKTELAVNSVVKINTQDASIQNDKAQLKKLKSMDKQELIDLAFKYSKDNKQEKPLKSGGVSFNTNTNTNLKPVSTDNSKTNDEAVNE